MLVGLALIMLRHTVMGRLLWFWAGGAIACCNLLGCDVVREAELPKPLPRKVTVEVPTDQHCEDLFCAFRTERREDSCEVSQLPPTTFQAPPDEPSMSVLDEEPFFLAMSRVWIGQTTLDGADDPTGAWETYGFDLDGLCTNTTTCEDSEDAPLCVPRAQSDAVDGAYCADNMFARLVGFASQAPSVGPQYGLTERRINCGLRRGEYNVLLRISDYNGLENDESVRIDLYSSPGLEQFTSLKCPDLDEGAPNPLTFPPIPAGAPWYLSSESVEGAVPANQTTPNSKFAIADAYVQNGMLVGHLPQGYDWVLPGDRSSMPGWHSRFTQFYVLGKLAKNKSNLWTIEQGIFAGVQSLKDMQSSFREVGLCGDEPGEPLSLVTAFLDEYADMPTNIGADPLEACDGVSSQIAFSAAQARGGQVLKTEPRVNCCEESNATSKACGSCGDGVLDEETELCDTAIPDGMPGACPTSCENMDSDPCQPLVVRESACQTSCEPAPVITEASSGDGCCPEGANSAADSDCTGTCGDGVQEGDELCDPPESCPTEDTCQVPESATCLVAAVSGSADECSAECTIRELGCVNDDGCCGAGCTFGADNDCSDTCGDGEHEPEKGELCDSDGCPTDCAQSSPDACVEMKLFGSVENCTARCEALPIIACKSGDGCCPDGCTALMDDDCETGCGNGSLEPGEGCDDGNTSDGDGCSSECTAEGGTMECLALSGAFEEATTQECIECVCSNCATEAVACGGTQDAQHNKLCQDLVACGLKKQCRGPLCLNICPDEVVAAAMVDDLMSADVATRYVDPDFPIYYAGKFSDCSGMYCMTECPVTSTPVTEP